MKFHLLMRRVHKKRRKINEIETEYYGYFLFCIHKQKNDYDDNCNNYDILFSKPITTTQEKSIFLTNDERLLYDNKTNNIYIYLPTDHTNFQHYFYHEILRIKEINIDSVKIIILNDDKISQ